MPAGKAIYELREYLVSDGRVADEIARARATILSETEGGTGLFDRHAVPRPWAIWRCLHGRPLPSMAFLYAWPGMSERSQAFTGLYVDPFWVDLRARTNGSHEIVSRIDDLVFTGPALPEPPTGSGIYAFLRDDGAAGAPHAGDIVLQPLAGEDARPLVIRKLGDGPKAAPVPYAPEGGKLFQLLGL